MITGHTDQASAMLHCWQHLTGFVCPKAVAFDVISKRAMRIRRSDYANTRGRGLT